MIHMAPLKNGCDLIEARPLSERNEFIVLARRDTGKRVEYVTWMAGIEDGQFVTWWGHYHGDNLFAAVEEYAARLGLERPVATPFDEATA